MNNFAARARPRELSNSPFDACQLATGQGCASSNDEIFSEFPRAVNAINDTLRLVFKVFRWYNSVIPLSNFGLINSIMRYLKIC